MTPLAVQIVSRFHNLDEVINVMGNLVVVAVNKSPSYIAWLSLDAENVVVCDCHIVAGLYLALVEVSITLGI